MTVIYDARGNEFGGGLDQIGGGLITDARVASATLGSLAAEIVMDIMGKGTATFDVRTAAGNMTLTFEATIDGTNYVIIPAINVVTETISTVVVITTTAAAVYSVACAGYRRVRVRASAYTSGNVVITGRASTAEYFTYSKPLPSSILVTATGIVNAAVTGTLAAGGAGLYHYITNVSLVKLYSVVGVEAGAGNIITSTNLPGNPSWTTEQVAAAAGTCKEVINLSFNGNPLKSSATNTATGFVAPAQLQTIWRWNISYYVGA